MAYRTHSHRCCLGRSFDDVCKVGLATTLWREVLTLGDALISTPSGLQEVRGTLRAPWCGGSRSVVELPYDTVSPLSHDIDLLQRYTILGLPFWLRSLLAMPLSSSVRSTSLGRRHGLSTPSRNVYGFVTLIRSWYRYAFFTRRCSPVIRCLVFLQKSLCLASRIRRRP